jgi:hypothetical protein
MRILVVGALACLFAGMGCGMKPGRDKKAKDEPMAQVDVEQKKNRPNAAPARERKIKYSGVIKVIVENFGKSKDELEELVIKNKGYVAQSEIVNSPGEARGGHWKLRIPVAHFQAVREAIARLGEPEKNTTDSEDVTEEYYDLIAHIKNKKEEEAGLQKLFQASAGKLEDILKVRAELTRVRTEIDQHEGRLNALKQLTEMTTLDVYLHDRHTYVPPEAATYGTTIERTFFGSIDVLIRLGKGVFLAIVAIVPWLPLIAVIVVPFCLLALRSRRLNRVRHPTVEQTPPPSPS